MRDGPINIDKVLRAHTRFKRLHHSLFDRQVEKIGRFAVQYVKDHPTFKRRTGNLQRQTEFRIVRLKSGAIVQIRNRAKYAAAIDSGSPRHLIVARRARCLSFIWKGVRVRFRWVMHPGNRPFKFLYRASNAAGRVFEPSMRSGMDNIAKKF